MATAEVTVRGAGIFGLSIAWECLKRGAEVRVIDPHGVAAGASGGIVGALAPHTPDTWNPKKQMQLESLLAAQAFWAEVEAVSGQSPGYARSGRLQPLNDARALDLARARTEDAARNWRGQARWDVVREAETAGWCPPSATGWILHDTLSARIHPKLACESLAAAIRARGGRILSEGTESAAVIHATGWQGLAALSRDIGSEMGNGVKGQAVLLRHHAPDAAPQVFAEGLHIIPHANGTVAIGSTSERDFTDPTSTDAQCDTLVERAAEAMPILHGAKVIARWAGVRPRARSRAPMLGPWPGRDGHFIANGGFKIGFGMAPAIAGMMADFVIGGHNRIPEAFRVEASL